MMEVRVVVLNGLSNIRGVSDDDRFRILKDGRIGISPLAKETLPNELPKRVSACRKVGACTLAANPAGTSELALGREARAIHQELKRSGYRDRFGFQTRLVLLLAWLTLLPTERTLPQISHERAMANLSSERGSRKPKCVTVARGVVKRASGRLPDGRAA